jgi:hypothetical protein
LRTQIKKRWELLEKYGNIEVRGLCFEVFADFGYILDIVEIMGAINAGTAFFMRCL